MNTLISDPHARIAVIAALAVIAAVLGYFSFRPDRSPGASAETRDDPSSAASEEAVTEPGTHPANLDAEEALEGPLSARAQAKIDKQDARAQASEDRAERKAAKKRSREDAKADRAALKAAVRQVSQDEPAPEVPLAETSLRPTETAPGSGNAMLPVLDEGVVRTPLDSSAEVIAQRTEESSSVLLFTDPSEPTASPRPTHEAADQDSLFTDPELADHLPARVPGAADHAPVLEATERPLLADGRWIYRIPTRSSTPAPGTDAAPAAEPPTSTAAPLSDADPFPSVDPLPEALSAAPGGLVDEDVFEPFAWVAPAWVAADRAADEALDQALELDAELPALLPAELPAPLLAGPALPEALPPRPQDQ